jgi:hypothetical protein
MMILETTAETKRKKRYDGVLYDMNLGEKAKPILEY